MKRRFKPVVGAGSGRRGRIPPTTIDVLASGEAIACYDGVPLLRYDSIDQLLTTFSLSPGEIEEIDEGG